MKKTLQKALVKLMICCAISLLIGCNEKPKWDWQPNTFRASYDNQAIVNSNNYQVEFSNPEISDYGCYHKTNISELGFNIQRLKKFMERNLTKRQKKIMYAILNDIKVEGLHGK